MDKLLKNGFWAGTAGALVVLVIVFAVLVAPKFATQANLEKEIRSKGKDLKNMTAKADENIKQWTERKTAMLGSYGKITDFYAASDKHLERWFDGFNGQDRGTFMARYREEVQKLEASLTERKTEIGIPDATNPTIRRFGFNWEEPLPDQWAAIIQGGPGEEARVLKDLQKRFWTRQRVAHAVLKGDVKVTRVHDFRFFRKLANLQSAGWDQVPTGADAVFWPGVKSDQPGQMPRNFQEYELPNGLGRTFTFGFALMLPYSEIPKILKEILNPDLEPRNESGDARLLVNLLGAQVTLRDQNKPLISYWYYEGDEAHRAAQKDKALKDAGITDIGPRDVLFAMTCQVVDFEPVKVQKLTAEPVAVEPSAPK
ncbi:MAG TPA: hypothetical protein VF950_23565 [Planctomycetota bacterium]